MKIFDKTELSKSQLSLLATEAVILRQLHHPNIVEVITEQESEARLCQVFELSMVSQSPLHFDSAQFDWRAIATMQCLF